MKKLVKNLFTLIISFIGLIGSIVWIIQSDWQVEPIIIGLISIVEIMGYIILHSMPETNGKVKVKTINFIKIDQRKPNETEINSADNRNNRDAILEQMKLKIKILFIDDDKNFNVVKILKDSGWKYTRTLTDIKTLDMPIVKESDMFFVDINGVGQLLGLENGLDLALMLKQKYPQKKVVIYSANKNTNAFHKAWDACDYRLEKNALPYQFQNLIEEYSLKN